MKWEEKGKWRGLGRTAVDSFGADLVANPPDAPKRAEPRRSKSRGTLSWDTHPQGSQRLTEWKTPLLFVGSFASCQGFLALFNSDLSARLSSVQRVSCLRG